MSDAEELGCADDHWCTSSSEEEKKREGEIERPCITTLATAASRITSRAIRCNPFQYDVNQYSSNRIGNLVIGSFSSFSVNSQEVLNVLAKSLPRVSVVLFLLLSFTLVQCRP